MSLTPIILNELHRGGPPLWVSGATYQAGAVVRSPADWRLYVRTAAGAGEADPSTDTSHYGSATALIEERLDAVDAAVAGLGQAVAAQTALPLWTPGLLVQPRMEIVSPADGEVYRRITAAGAGNTDPADDLVNYVARSYCRVTSISGQSAYTSGANLVPSAQCQKSSGSYPAARTLAFEALGRGRVSTLILLNQSASSIGGTTRVEVVIDGRTISDRTIGAIAQGYGVSIMGGGVDGGNSVGPIDFRRRLALYFTPTVAIAEGGLSLYFAVSGVA